MAAINPISKIKLPNNTEYTIKDNSQSRSVHNHITSDIKPLLSKTYENYTVTANDGNNGVIYFGTIMPNNLDNYFAPWWIHYTLEVTTSEIYTQGYYDVYIGAAGTSITYHIFNNIYSTNYYPIYYHRLLYPKQDYQEQGAHIGVRIQGARSSTTLARTYKIDLLEQYGCTFSFKDSLVTYGTLYNATYYNTGEYSASPGLQETADSDTTGRDFSHSGYLINSSTFRMAPFTLFGLDRENEAQGISLYSSEYTSSTTNINTARVYNTAGFDWTRGIWHTNTWTNFAKGANLNISPSEFYYSLDFRYTDNCVASATENNLGLIMRKPVYFRGYIKEDGLFYLDPISVTYNNTTYQRAWTQDIPTTKTYHGIYRHVFWNIGMPYYNSSYPNSGYQINLHTENRLYWYSDNNRFEEYILEAQKVNGHTVAIDIPSTAKLTDTITTLAISGSPSITNTPQSGAVTLGAAAVRSITDNSSNADVTSSDTNLITGRTLYYQLAKKGYTTNTGTVTKITTGSGLTGGPITTTGTISIATGGVTNDMLAGSIANGKLANSSISIAGTSVSLGGTLAAETLRTNLGLSNAMHFIGKATVAITDGSTTNPTISGYDFTNKKTAGDVIIDKDTAYEYVWTTEGKWERLGGDSSYKVTQTAVAKPDVVTNKWVSAIGQNTNGVIDVSYTTLDTSGTWAGSAGSITSLTTSDKASNTDTWRYVWFSYNDLTKGRPAYSDKLVYQTSTNTLKIDTGTLTATQYSGNAATATTATNLASKPSLAVSDTSKITVTAGGKTSDAFTVPYATSAGSAAAATTATNLSAAPTITATGTATVNLAANTAYTLTVGGKSVVFKTPSDANTNTLVNYTLGETTKAYLMASQNAPTTTTTARAAHGDTGVYLTTTAGEFSAVRHSYNVAGAERAYTHYNMTDQSIDFVFV